jgi:hypothetical protein
MVGTLDPMSTTILTPLPSVPELVRLLRTAFPMHWEIRIRNLGITHGRELPEDELALLTEQVFWLVRQTGMKDPAAWLAYRAQLAAARVKPETLANLAASAPLERGELEASNLCVAPARTSDASAPSSARPRAKIEPLSRAPAGDVLPEGAPLAPAADAGSTCVAETSAPNGDISGGDDQKASRDYGDPLVSALPEGRSSSIEPTSLPNTLAPDSGSLKGELLPRAEAILGESQADAGKAESSPPKAASRRGRTGRPARKAQKTSTSGSKHKRTLLMRQVLRYLTTHPNFSAAARKIDIYTKTPAYWLKRSKAGDPAYELTWRGVTLPFHEHCEEAKAEATDMLMEMAWEWTQERIV